MAKQSGVAAVRPPLLRALLVSFAVCLSSVLAERDWRQSRRPPAASDGTEDIEHRRQQRRVWQRSSSVHPDGLLTLGPDSFLEVEDGSDSPVTDDGTSAEDNDDGDNKHDQTDGKGMQDDDDGPVCAPTHHDRHHFRNFVNSGRVRHVLHDDEFVLATDEQCTDIMDVPVSVVPLINHVEPFKSEAYINMPPFLGGGTFYVCWKRNVLRYGAGKRQKSRCFAVVEQPLNFFSLVGGLTQSPGFGPLAKKGILIYRAGRRSNLIPLVAAAWLISVLAATVVVIYAFFLYITLPPRETMEPPEPLSLGTPVFILGESIMKMVSVVFAIVAFVGVSTDYVVRSCGGTYTMIIAVWPTIFGILAIWRMAVLVAKDQLYNAALRRGKCLDMAIEVTKWDGLLVCSWIVLAGCVAYGMLISDADTLAYFELVSPCLVLGVNTGKFVMKELEHSLSKCMVVLDLLASDLKGNDGSDGRTPTNMIGKLCSIMQTSSSARRESMGTESAALRARGSYDPTSSSMLKSMQAEDEDWKIPEAAFCTCCRQGLDPLDDDFEFPPEEDWGSTFGFRDLWWMGSYMHRAIGTRTSLVLLPTVCVLVCMVMWSTLECATHILVPPQLVALESTEGDLFPTFYPRIKEYSLKYDRHVHSLTFFTKTSAGNSRSTNFKLSGVPLNQTVEQTDLTQVDLRSKFFPMRVTIGLEGYGDTSTWYDVQLVPVVHLLTTIVVSAEKTTSGQLWERCTPFAHEPVTRIVWIPDKTKPATVKLSVQDFAPSIPMSLKEAADLKTAFNILSVFEPTDTTKESLSCARKCDLTPRCLHSEVASNGCYFGYGPQTRAGRDSCMKMHRYSMDNGNTVVVQKADAAKSVQVIGKLCWEPPHHLLGTNGTDDLEMICKHQTANSQGYLEFEDFQPLWEGTDGIYFKSLFMLLHRTNSGEESVVTTHHLEFVSGPPLPHIIWVWVAALQRSLSVRADGDEIMRVNLDEFFPPSLKSRIINVTVAAPIDSMDLFTFTFSANDCDLTQASASDLPCDLPEWAELQVCNRSTGLASRAVVWQLPVFEPQGHVLNVERNKKKSKWARSQLGEQTINRTLKIILETKDGEEPAQWAMRQSCSLDFRGVPHALTRRWLSPKVFNEAALMCEVIKMVYTMEEDIPTSVREFEFSVDQFINFGIWLHSGHLDVIRMLESAAKNSHGLGPQIFELLGVTSDRSMVLVPESSKLPHNSTALLPLYYHELNYTRLPVELSWDEIFQGIATQKELIELLCNNTLKTDDASMLMYRAASLHGSDATRAVQGVKRCSKLRPSVHFESNTEGTSGLVASLKYGSRYAFGQLFNDPRFHRDEIVSQARKPGRPVSVVLRSWADFAIRYGRDFAFKHPLTDKISIRKINLAYMSLSGESLNYLLDAKAFDSTEDLDISHNELPPEGFAILASKLRQGFFPHLRRFACADLVLESNCTTPSQFDFLKTRVMVEDLDVSDNYFCDSDIMVLAQLMSSAVNLTRLNISYSRFSEVGVEALAKAFTQRSALKSLDLTANNVGKVGAALGLHSLTELEHLHYADNELQESNPTWFADALKSIPKLETLNIAHNDLTNEGMLVVLEPLAKSEALKKLILRNNPAGGLDMAKKLGEFLKGLPALEELDMSWTRLGSEVLNVARVDGLKELQTLRLQSSGITDASLAEALPHLPKLKILNIDWNKLDAASLASVGRWPETLEELTMSNCQLGVRNLEHLAAIARKLPHLHVLSLGNNSLGAATPEHWKTFLDELVKMHNMFSLRLHKNGLGAQGVSTLVDVWVSEQPRFAGAKSRLHEFDLSGNGMGKDGITELMRLLRSDIMDHLHSLSLISNNLEFTDVEPLIHEIEAGRIMKKLRILRIRGDGTGTNNFELDEVAVLQDRIPWVLLE